MRQRATLTLMSNKNAVAGVLALALGILAPVPAKADKFSQLEDEQAFMIQQQDQAFRDQRRREEARHRAGCDELLDYYRQIGEFDKAYYVWLNCR